MKAGGGALVSLKYSSKFRDLSHAVMNEINNPIILQEGKGIPGLVTTNKKLAARLEASKKEGGAAGGAADAKKGGKGAPAAPAKEEKKGKEAPAKAAKGGPTADEEAAEAERLRIEAEEAEKERLAEIERNFDKKGELKSLGGAVSDFDVEDQNRRTQHYDWLLPVYYKIQD